MDSGQRSLFEQEVVEPLLSMIERHADNDAFCIRDIFYTYADLARSIATIRSAIRNLPKDECNIGLAANDDLETYASIFALWLEGRAYVPLHPHQPMDRCEAIITQISIRTILDSTENSRFHQRRIIHTKRLSHENAPLHSDHVIDDDALAYVLFTSGSTGIPKGVMISRRNLGAFMDAFRDSGISLTDNDKCLQCFDLTFDVSVQCFLAPLTKGACVFTIPHDQIKYSYAHALLEDYHLTFAAMAPSMLRYLRPYFSEIFLPDLRCCILTGEASPADLVREWGKCAPKADMYDFYGPTEATIYCTYYRIPRGEHVKSLHGMLSIGKPMKHVEAIVIGEHDELLPANEKGELCITGDQVSPGYWNSPEKNAQAFFEKELRSEAKRFYRTGDLCYISDNGYLMLYGRLDSQIKIQGYRVELGEIEFHAREFLDGGNVAVLNFTNQIGNTELVMFIEGADADPGPLVDYLKRKLPAYMVPGKTIVKPEFPLNPNGKVDKGKLRQSFEEYRPAQRKRTFS